MPRTIRSSPLATVAVLGIAALMVVSPAASALDLIQPTGGEYLSGDATVEWQDNDDEDTYELVLADSGVELEPKLCEECSGFTFSFDTSKYADSREYVLKLDDDDGRGTEGNDEEVTTDGTFTIDNTPPETTSFLDASQGDDGWFTTDVTVELSGSDETAGVDETFYAVDGGAQQTYTDSFRVTGDGTHTVDFHSVDRAGNAEATQTVTVPIDTTDPTSQVTIGEPTLDSGRVLYVSGQTEIALSATDATSGVDHIEYRVNHGAYQTYTGPFTLSGEDGEQVLEWRAVDEAGNVETANELRLELDDTAPELTRERPQPGGLYAEDTLVAETHPVNVEADQVALRQTGTEADTVGFAVAEGNLTVQATSVDAGSGTGEVRFFVDGELRFTDTQRPYEWTWTTGEERLGEHDLRIESEDRLGSVANTVLPVEVVPTGSEGLNQTADEGPSIPDRVPAPEEPSPLGLEPVDTDHEPLRLKALAADLAPGPLKVNLE